jgi:hypothetical protein
METDTRTTFLESRFNLTSDGPTEPAKGPFGRPVCSPGQSGITNRRGRVWPGRRAKVFGFGNGRPLTSAMKNILTAEARRMTRRTQRGKHYGLVTAKQFAVFRTLIWKFHNCVTGWCFPSYEAIAEEVGCHRDTVHQAIAALEAVGLLTWDHRIRREQHRILRTSNGYRFKVPPHLQITKSEIPSRTAGQAVLPLKAAAPIPPKPSDPDLMASLDRLNTARKTYADRR